ncbi:MAG: hypothetical protein C4558_01905 [Dehalococcoidia bacterium]|nr:MAG: hypothetical protein C4558_01905 [Dehalococcoidia bacterium]
MTTPEEKDEGKSAPSSGDQPEAVPLFGPPFGPAFFMSVLKDRVRQQCDQQPEAVPVVELHLGDGTTLDLCHVPGLGPQWIAAEFYRDRETCNDMDLSFIPFALITRVTVSMWHRSQRSVGFDITRPTDAA